MAPAHNQGFVLIPGVVAHRPPVNENTPLIEKISNLGEGVLQNYLSYLGWWQWSGSFHLLRWGGDTWKEVMKWMRVMYGPS